MNPEERLLARGSEVFRGVAPFTAFLFGILAAEVLFLGALLFTVVSSLLL